MSRTAPGTPMPGLAKARGLEEPVAAAEPVDLASELAQLKEKTDAERVELNREIEKWKKKFTSADAEVSRYQTAVAQLVGLDDANDRQAIRDGLCGPSKTE